MLGSVRQDRQQRGQRDHGVADERIYYPAQLMPCNRLPRPAHRDVVRGLRDLGLMGPDGARYLVIAAG
jgi:hypothetical protein